MAKEFECIDLESQQSDKSPLLNDPKSLSKGEEIFVTQSTSSAFSSSTVANVLPNEPNTIPIIQNEVIFSGKIVKQ